MKAYLVIFSLLMGFILFPETQAQQARLTPIKIPGSTFRIGGNSVLKLEGATNVNNFECLCEDDFVSQTYQLEKSKDATQPLLFQNTAIKLKTNKLDCGNKMMNKDLQKALYASESPYITIQLLEASQEKCNQVSELKDWVKVKTLVRITIHKTSKEYWLDISVKKNSAKQFRFIGTKTLQMKDFGIEPPTAMMGMVKVKNDIKIKLDLEVFVE